MIIGVSLDKLFVVSVIPIIISIFMACPLLDLCIHIRIYGSINEPLSYNICNTYIILWPADGSHVKRKTSCKYEFPGQRPRPEVQAQPCGVSESKDTDEVGGEGHRRDR